MGSNSPITTSARIRLLKDRFHEDITYEDYGLRHTVYLKVAEENPGVPADRRIALSYARFLEEKNTSVHEHDLLAGKLHFYGYGDSFPVSSKADGKAAIHGDEGDLHPMFSSVEYSDKEIEIQNHLRLTGAAPDSEEAKLLRSYSTALRIKMCTRWASGHVIAGYEKVLREGVGGLIAEGERALKNAAPEQRDCVEAMLIADRAFQRYILRYAASAREKAAQTGSDEYRTSLLRIVQACENISSAPPKNFFEAVQLLMLTHDAIICESVPASISLGRVDYILTPFYQADLAKGAITFDQAGELIDALWLKLAQLRGGFQHVTLGGCDHNGKFTGNDLTILGMRASRKLMFDQPLLSLRTHPDMPDLFWDEAQGLLETGLGFPALFNDQVVFAAKERDGIRREDLWRYGIVGCVECAIGGAEYGRTEELRLSWAKPLELMLSGGICTCTGEALPLKTARELDSICSFTEFYNWYLDELRHYATLCMRACNLLDSTYGRSWPVPFMSSTMDCCYQKGEDVTRGGTRYNLSTLNGCAMADTVDSLHAIRTIVFEKKVLTLSQLAETLLRDFSSDEPLRLTLENLPGRYGNDYPPVDEMMRSLTDFFSSLGKGFANPFGTHFQIGLYTVAEHAWMGAVTGALPSGRHKGVSLANGLSPCQGGDRKDPSAVVCSTVHNDLANCGNGMVLDLKFSPSFLKKPVHRLGVRNLIRTYFEQGGMEIQFNVVSRETLLAAQKNPQQYRNLIVRVSGYSAYFYSLDPVLQNEIIARTEYTG